MNTVFLFAHQDDEYGVFPALHEHRRRGDAVHCVYLTDGGPQAQRRCRESLAVLAELDIAAEHVHVPGCQYSCKDGRLYEQYADCCRWLVRLLAELAPVGTVYIPAWEGGHPDHDTVHAAAVVAACRQKKSVSRIRQFSLYNGYRCSGLLFRAMLPLPCNGPVLHTPLPLALRLRCIRLCLRYPSQWKTWLGLFFPVALRYLFTGTQQTQAVLSQRRDRPHAGQLYYERRGFCTWETLSAALTTNPFEVHHE